MCDIIFNSSNDVMFGVVQYFDDVVGQNFDTSFKVVDAVNFSSIGEYRFTKKKKYLQARKLKFLIFFSEDFFVVLIWVTVGSRKMMCINKRG